MPVQLSTRLSEAEFHGLIASINSTLQPLSGFGVLSLLLPFLVVDVLTLVLLSSIDPWLILSPWDYPLADLLLPLGLEFCVIFFSFPLMARMVNRRMGEVQKRVGELLDDSSRRFGARGVSFQLKQGIINNGAATNLWVEAQVVPMIHVQSPVPVPVPTVCPVLVPASARVVPTASPAATSTPADMSTPAATAAATPAGAGGAGSVGGASHAPTAPGTGGPPSTASTGQLSVQQVEYLRVLQENQLLRQYLNQCQQLVQTLAQQVTMQQQQLGDVARSGGVGTPANAAANASAAAE